MSAVLKLSYETAHPNDGQPSVFTGPAQASSARHITPVDHGGPMELQLFGESPAVTLENGDNFSGQTLLQRLPRFAVASFQDPFHSEPRSLFLAQSNGLVDVLRTPPMGQAFDGWRGGRDGLT